MCVQGAYEGKVRDARPSSQQEAVLLQVGLQRRHQLVELTLDGWRGRRSDAQVRNQAGKLFADLQIYLHTGRR